MNTISNVNATRRPEGWSLLVRRYHFSYRFAGHRPLPHAKATRPDFRLVEGRPAFRPAIRLVVCRQAAQISYSTIEKILHAHGSAGCRKTMKYLWFLLRLTWNYWQNLAVTELV